MSRVPLWFERRFAFEFPADAFPNICVRLRGTPARLEEMVSGLDPEVRTRKPSGGWSIQEHAGHLLDLETLWAARCAEFAEGAQTLSGADLTNSKTHEAAHNTGSLDDILAAFRESRTGLVERMDELSPDCWGQTALHPRLQTPMRLVDHLYFVAEHDDHHVAWIWELRRER